MKMTISSISGSDQRPFSTTVEAVHMHLLWRSAQFLYNGIW